jgi:hypothetical protein
MDVARVVPDDDTELGEDAGEPAGVGPEIDDEE